MLSPARVASRHVARSFTPSDVAKLVVQFKSSVDEIDARVKAAPPKDDGTRDYVVFNIRLQVQWRFLVRAGSQLATWMVETRALPAGKAKAVELAARTFISAVRDPRDVAAWWEKNRKHAMLILDAVKWPEKSEAGGAGGVQEKLTVGQFTVHNTLHLEGAKLASTVGVLEKAAQLVRSVGPFAKILYGDVFIVGKLEQPRTMAWYYPKDDTVYLRPQNLGKGEQFNLIHELGHRYWFKFMPGDGQRQWNTRYFLMKNTNAPKVTLPEPGQPLGFKIKGLGDEEPIVESYGRGLDGSRKINLVGGGSVYANAVYAILEKNAITLKFPTPYSATHAEEYFAESFALYVTGDLGPDHREAFEQAAGL
jgi:hypothetical protein